MKNPPSLREQKKAETRANTLEIAHRLFHAKGYDSTTVEEICEASRISKRTFFRYFDDKEALVFPNREERLEGFVDFLENSPQKESPFDTLRRATRLFGADYMENSQQILAQQALVASSAELLAREREIDNDWEKEIAKAIIKRAPDGTEMEQRAGVLAGAIIGVIRATMREWFEGRGKGDLVQIGIGTLDCLERGFPIVSD